MKTEDEALRQPFSKLWKDGYTYMNISSELQIPFTKALTLRLAFGLPPRMSTRYSIAGKQLNPITDEDFVTLMQTGDFKKPDHKGYATGLYYTAVRREELRRATKQQFQITKTDVVFSVQKRLKHGIETPPLKIPKEAAFMDTVIGIIVKTNANERVFPYSKKTCYNIMQRAGFHYPHFCRLSRITNFFLEGWTIPQVHSWTGLSLRALNFYLGLVDIDKMGRSLIKNQ
jgi:integrase